jgi:tRNA threonylcarbamoyl adenosine modification protein (Sua5/YciO/YrdC/YwlC family)
MKVEDEGDGCLPHPAALATARRALESGLVVALPTDTVYGLAVDPARQGAADRLFAVKRRPRGVELPVLVADVEQALSLAHDPAPWVRRLMVEFWPGPLTLVVPRRPDLQIDLGDDRATIGLRCPDHPVPRALCRLAGSLAVTSANHHGQSPLSTASEVAEVFGGEVEVILDGGRCAGVPSTVIDGTGPDPRCLRQGGLNWDRIASALT